MKKAEYYQNTLVDLKKEQGRESRVLKDLNEILTYLQSKKYQSVDSLEGLIKELEARRGKVKGAIKRIEEAIH
jgi:hypothetical protein